MKPFAIVLLLCALSMAETVTLQQAEQTALNQGYDIQIDSLDDQARVWQKRNVVSGYMPQISYSANLMRMDDSTAGLSGFKIGAPDPATGMPTFESAKRPNSFTQEIALSQPISNGGMEIVAIKMAKHTKKAQELGYEANKAELMLNVRKAYFDLITVQEQKKLAEQDLEWAQKRLSDAELNFESGTLPQTELLRWKTTVLEKESQVKQIEALRLYQVANLKVAMGEDPQSSRTIEPESFETFEKTLSELSASEGTVDENLTVQSLNEYREISHYSRKMALSSSLPKLNAFASVGRDISWNDTDFDNANTGYRKWTIGMGLNVPLFSGMRNSTSYMEKKYDAMKADVDYKKNRDMMETNLIRLKSFMEASRIAAQSSKEQYDLNNKNFAIMNDRYELGQINQLDLFEMNQAVTASRLNYVTRTLEAITYYSEYQNAIGKLEAIQ